MGVMAVAVNCFSVCSIRLFKFGVKFRSLVDEDPKAVFVIEFVVNPGSFPALAEFLVFRTVGVSFVEDIFVSVVRRIKFYCFRNHSTKLSQH
jgi:hypothetical protein